MRTGSVRSLTENGGMTQTTHRVLRLLGLLETRTTWRGDELAERLGVTGRTVRRDVARLRDLGYPVEAEPGMAGGYRLGGGRRLPPLVLEDDEAVALVACLRMAALTGGDAVGEAALRALTKLDQVLPARLRAVAAAIDGATRAMPRVRPAVDLRVLEQLAVAQRDHNLVRFYYCKPRGGGGTREVEPARLITQGEHWYLQAYDREREDWRVFRLDRMRDLKPSTWRFAPREAPDHDFRRDLASRYECVMRVEVEVDAQRLEARLPAPYRTELEATATGCSFVVGAPTWDDLAWHLLSVSRDLNTALILPTGPAADAFRQALGRISRQATSVAQGRPPEAT